jgi:DNA-binding transcriptional ArsR family regulator
MSKEPFLLVSLNEDKAKKLSQVLSNPTATRILEHLSGKDATATQISEDLKIPLSTVHYNLQQLVEAKLVLAEEFHYSSRGKEVNHYKLANKYIIIAPAEEQETLLKRLKGLLPIALVTLGAAVILKAMQAMTGTLPVPGADLATQETAPMALKTTADAAGQAAPLAAEPAADTMMQTTAAGANDAARTMMESAVAQNASNASAGQGAAMIAAPENVTTFAPQAPSPETLVQPHTAWWMSPAIDWFLAGAVFVLLVLVAYEAISYWRGKRRPR